MKLPRLGMRRFWVRRATRQRSGSLTRRMIGIAALWIGLLLGVGGYTLDRVLTNAITSNFDAQLDYVLTSMIGTAEIGPEGEVLFTRAPADQRFLEPYSGLYYQVSGEGFDPFPSRSLWDRRLEVREAHNDSDAHYYDSDEFPMEKLRVIERDARLPGSPVRWRFQVAQNREVLDEQIGVLRRTLVRSFGILALGLLVLAALQAIYGLWPLRRVRRAIAAIRTGQKSRIDEKLPREIEPLTEELNDLLEHNETQAEEARRHAGNLAHALKTPLTVVNNAATAQSPDLADTVIREARTMRRQVDHLERARLGADAFDGNEGVAVVVAHRDAVHHRSQCRDARQLLAPEEGDRFDARCQVLPELVDVDGTGEPACHADDGDSVLFVRLTHGSAPRR